jgi:transposase
MARRTKLEPHLTPEELHERYRTATDRAVRSHFQALWLITQGHSQERAGEVVGYTQRWVQEIVKRYNAHGPDAMRDRRHEHPGVPRTLAQDDERELKKALEERPADGGIWTSKKAAAWISKRVGRKISTTSGWRTLRRMGQTPKRPRPRHRNADPQAQEAFKEAAAEADGRSTGTVSGRGGRDLGDR